MFCLFIAAYFARRTLPILLLANLLVTRMNAQFPRMKRRLTSTPTVVEFLSKARVLLVKSVLSHMDLVP